MYANYLADFDILSTILNTFEEEEVSELMGEAKKIIESQTEKMANVLEEYMSESADIEDLSNLVLIQKELDNEEAGE